MSIPAIDWCVEASSFLSARCAAPPGVTVNATTSAITAQPARAAVTRYFLIVKRVYDRHSEPQTKLQQTSGNLYLVCAGRY